MPPTLVDIVPNSPRYSAGALGLGSHMSMWLGPPRIQRMMTERIFDGVGCEAAEASCRKRSPRARPDAPSAPALRKLRRLALAVCNKSRQPPVQFRLFDIACDAPSAGQRIDAHLYVGRR